MAKRRKPTDPKGTSSKPIFAIAAVVVIILVAYAFTSTYSFSSYEGACEVQLDAQNFSALLGHYLGNTPTSYNGTYYQFQGGPCHLLYMNETIPSFNLTLPGMVIGQPVVYKGILLVPISGQKNTSNLNTTWGRVEAFNASTQKLMWVDNFTDFVMTQPVVARGIAYVGTGTDFVNFTAPNMNNVAAINITTGAVVWSISTLQENKPTFIFFNNSIIKLPGLGSNGDMVAYNLSTGKQIWSLNLGGYSAEGSAPVVGDVAYVSLRNIMEPSTPGENSSNLYAPAPIHNSTIYAVNLMTHKILWGTTFNASLGMQDTSPSVWGDVVVTGYAIPITPVQQAVNPFTSPQYNISVYLVGLDASNGKLLWTFNMGSGLVSANIEVDPTSSYNNIVYADAVSTGVLYAINMTTGSKVWSVQTGPAIGDVNIVDGYAIISNDQTGDVFVINATTGLVKHMLDMNMPAVASVGIVGNSLLFSSFHIKTMTGGIESLPISQVLSGKFDQIPTTNTTLPPAPANSHTPQPPIYNNASTSSGPTGQSVYCASCFN